MTRSRLFELMLTALCLVGVWLWGLGRTVPAAPWWLSGLHVAAFMGWFSTTFDKSLPGRRLQVALSACLSLSTLLLQYVPISSATPAWPEVSACLDQLLSPHGLRTQWQAPILPLALGLPLVLISLLAHGMHQVPPRFIRRLAIGTAGLWLLVFFLSIGAWVRHGVPSAAFLIGLLVLPWMLRSNNWPVPALLLSLCVCACLHIGLGWLWNIQEVISLLCAAAMAGTVLCWLSWFWLMNDIARYDLAHPTPPSAPAPSPPPTAAMPQTFDLSAHLDSPSAQEGADKYTRE